jgi:magnesium chelatase family protein
LGELGLDGQLRPVCGVLPAVAAAAAAGFRKVAVPEASAQEATLVPEMAVVGAPALSALLAWLRGDREAGRAVTVRTSGDGASIQQVRASGQTVAGRISRSALLALLIRQAPVLTWPTSLGSRLRAVLPKSALPAVITYRCWGRRVLARRCCRTDPDHPALTGSPSRA